MTEIFLSPKAEQDLLAIWDYSFGNWGKAQADQYLRRLNNAIHQLSAHPELGRRIDDIKQDYRSFSHDKHLILYRLDAAHIVIARVLRSEMDIQRHL